MDSDDVVDDDIEDDEHNCNAGCLRLDAAFASGSEEGEHGDEDDDDGSGGGGGGGGGGGHESGGEGRKSPRDIQTIHFTRKSIFYLYDMMIC